MKPFAFVLRWVMPVVGLLAVAVGLVDAPRRGEPPLASMLGRAETVVRSASVEPAGFAGDRPRYEAFIDVVWPPGADATALLRGLGGNANTGSQAAAEALVAAYPPGRLVQVRVAEGLPWADRTDWFALFWTLGAVVLGGLLATVGLLLNRVTRP